MSSVRGASICHCLSENGSLFLHNVVSFGETGFSACTISSTVHSTDCFQKNDDNIGFFPHSCRGLGDGCFGPWECGGVSFGDLVVLSSFSSKNEEEGDEYDVLYFVSDIDFFCTIFDREII